MYLSLTALKNMNIVDKEFPVASVSNITQSDDSTKYNGTKLAPWPMDIDNKFKNRSRNVTLRVRLTHVLIKNCR